jgi:hypothetical protein
MLSTPSTISIAVSDPNAIQVSGFSTPFSMRAPLFDAA